MRKTAAAHDSSASDEGSERPRQAVKLDDSEAYYRQMADNTPVMTWITDADGKCVYLNKQWYSYTGQSKKQALGIGWLDVVHPDDAQRSGRIFLNANNRHVSFSLEYRLRAKDGSYRWMLDSGLPRFNADGAYQGYVGSVIDINERKHFEQQLRQSEERFRFMAESMPQKIFTVRPDGVVDYFNPLWEQYTGITLQTLLHDQGSRQYIVHPDDLRAVTAVWQKAFRRHQPAEYEYRMRRHDGEYRWHIGRMNPLLGADGTISLWVGSISDVHDMRQATERRHELEIKTATLTEQRAQLMELNQAKDEFISLASHQLRTPATGVKQYIGMLLQGFAGELSDEQKIFLETAYESNERQINIVNDLLQVARIDAGKVTLRKRKTDLVRLVKNVMNEHSSQFQIRNQKLLLKLKSDKVKTPADADRIRMVLDNIIDNASKYTPNGRSVTISLSERQHDVAITISDEGIGIDAADTEKIFQKFSRLESPQVKGVEGSGLGLYWAKKIVDLHNGRISVRSKPGRGTAFTITLPH